LPDAEEHEDDEVVLAHRPRLGERPGHEDDE
jgi:hypothetical protein